MVYCHKLGTLLVVHLYATMQLRGGSRPLVSIIMPTKDQSGFIEASMDTVLTQDYDRIELLVIDGNSSDDTVERVRSRMRKDKRIRLLSGPDSGPAEAINRGFTLARGTVFAWLNSDDLYSPATITQVMKVFQNDVKCLMVYGRGQHVDETGRDLGDYPTRTADTGIEAFAEGCFICQPTVFFRRSMWVLLGDLDELLQTAFDFDYWLRAFRSFPGRIRYIDSLLAQSRLHEKCITVRMRQVVILEGMRVLARHLGAAPKEWLLTYFHELCDNPSISGEVDDLRLHVKETLEVARPWMGANDYHYLCAHLDEIIECLSER